MPLDLKVGVFWKVDVVLEPTTFMMMKLLGGVVDLKSDQLSFKAINQVAPS